MVLAQPTTPRRSVTRLLNQAEAAELLRLSQRTMERMRCVGGGPRFVRLRGSIRYRIVDIEEWIALRFVRVMTETSLVNPPSTTATLPPTAELLALSDTELGQRIDAHHDAIEKQKKIPIRLSMIS
jgi:predicted DNA-binding transcriptional regulator AlpA